MSNDPSKKPGSEENAPEEPALFALTRAAGGYALTRRSFLGLGILAAAGPSTIAAADTPNNTARPNVGLCHRTRRGQNTPCESIPAHEGAVNALVPSPDGSFLLSGGADGAVKLWTLPEWRLTRIMDHSRSPVESLAIGKSGALIVSAGTLPAAQAKAGSSSNAPTRGLLRFWSLPRGSMTTELPVEADSARALAIDASSNLIAAAGEKIRVWNLADRTPVCELAGHTGQVRGLSFVGDAPNLVSCSDDGTVRTWQIPGTTVGQTDSTHTAAVSALAVLPGGKEVVSVGEDQKVCQHPLPSLSPAKTFSGHAAKLRCVVLDPTGSLAATGGDDGCVVLWRLSDGTVIRRFQAPKQADGKAVSINAVAFAENGRILAAGDSVGRILLWETEDPDKIWSLYDPRLHKGQFSVKTVSARDSLSQDGICTCNQICTCNSVAVGGAFPDAPGSPCTCNTVTTGTMASGGSGSSKHTSSMSGNVCGCDTVCSCDQVCTCNSVSSGSGGGSGGGSRSGGGYWYSYPN